jgi:hypothetical protein
MTPRETIAEFAEYERRLVSILEGFTETRDAIHIDKDDDPLYRQYVQELIDLFDDSMGKNDYSRQIDNFFQEGIRNYVGSPSHKSVENILGVVRAALTRLRRRPELLANVGVSEKFVDGSESTSDFLNDRPIGRPFVQDTPLPLRAASLAMVRGSAESTVTPDPIALHAALMARVAALEYALAQRPADVPGIGHNNPPEEISDGANPTQEDIVEIEAFIAALKAQPPNPRERPTEILAQIEKFEGVGKKFRDYFDKLGTKAFESAGTELGKVIVSPQSWFWLSAAWAVHSVSDAAMQWLHALPH